MKKLLGLITALCLCGNLFAAYNSFGIPDSSEIRKNLQEKWFEAPLSVVRDNKPEIVKNNIGEEFQVRMEENETTYNIFVSPEMEINVDVYSDSGVEIIKQTVYPGDMAGSFVVVRDKKTEKTLRIRYYFLKNSDIYVQFTPYGKTALADLIVYGKYAARGVSTGVPFVNYYSTSFEEVYRTTENKIPWNYVLIDTTDYHSVKQMVAVIQEKIPTLVLMDDAMYDDKNQLVRISNGKEFPDKGLDSNIAKTPQAVSNRANAKEPAQAPKLALSSAGFIKWIADGLVEPIAGGRLKREPLIKETVQVKSNGLQGVLSQTYNLYFSLDWIRNLASAVVSVYTGKTYLFNQSGVDVTINPFASSITEKGVENIVTFIEDSGYRIEVLKPMLYVLAASDPGTFYFGAIRGTDRSVSPEVKAFNECVAFFPYFNNDGGFECAVFMNGREFTLENFCMYYEDSFVYLTRVKSSENFFPQ